MQTIVINSQKGGSGKTTLCANLAVEAAKTSKVCLVDTDPQGSLTLWHKKRTAENPARIDEPLETLSVELNALAAIGTEYTFIDTAPTRGEDTARLFKLADFVIIPALPSITDIWAVIPTAKLVQSVGKPFVFVLNKVKPNTTLTAQAAALLSKYGTVSSAMVYDRVHYAAAVVDHLTAPELDRKGKAAKEIAALWQTVKDAMNEPHSLEGTEAHA